jgi:5-methylcytosine-specific restriction endonuclease McrA
MSVTYDREKDVLIYERKLRDGPGHRMYGIEICKSLHLPDDFIEKAYSLRNKYYAETTGALSHKPSVYNSGKIRGMCEMCGEEMAKETHHIAQQKDANPANGYISTPDAKVFHKNHFSNLMGLCEKCHDKVHSGGEAAANENPHPADAADATDIAPPPPLKKKVVYRRKNKI